MVRRREGGLKDAPVLKGFNPPKEHKMSVAWQLAVGKIIKTTEKLESNTHNEQLVGHVGFDKWEQVADSVHVTTL